MTVGVFVQPNFETQEATEYKTNLDNCLAVTGQIAGQFAPHAAAVPNMTVLVDIGRLFVDGELVVRSQQTSATITAPTTNNRIDRVVMDSLTGTISVITGTEAASPSPPDIPSGKMPICQIALTPSTTTITNQIITDERVSPGGEVSSSPPGMPVGMLTPFAGLNAPEGWLLCYGQAISRVTYSALFAVIGTVYGVGNGTSTFNLPDCRGRVIAGKDNMGGTNAGRLSTVMAGYSLGAVGGNQSHVLSVAEMPSHAHQLQTNYAMGTSAIYEIDSVFNNLASLLAYPQDPYTATTGGGGAHNNVQPTIIGNVIIYSGVY